MEGFPTAYPFESLDVNMNYQIHTVNDTTTQPGFSFSHLDQFTKLTVASAMELAI